MSRTYSKRQCWFCKQSVSAAGAAWNAHMRKHVREGVAEERGNRYDGYYFHPVVVKEQSKEHPTK